VLESKFKNYAVDLLFLQGKFFGNFNFQFFCKVIDKKLSNFGWKADFSIPVKYLSSKAWYLNTNCIAGILRYFSRVSFFFPITLLDCPQIGDLYTENAIFFHSKLAACSASHVNERLGMRRYHVHANYRLASRQATMNSLLGTLFM